MRVLFFLVPALAAAAPIADLFDAEDVNDYSVEARSAKLSRPGKTNNGPSRVEYTVPLDVIAAGQLAVDAWKLAHPPPPAKRDPKKRPGGGSTTTTTKPPGRQAKTSSGKVLYEVPLDVIGAGQLAIDAWALANPQPAKRDPKRRPGGGSTTPPKKPTGQAKTSSGKVVYEVPLDVIGAGQLAIDAWVLANPQPAKRDPKRRPGGGSTTTTPPKKPTGQAKTSSGKVVYEVPLDVIGAGQLAIDAWVLANPQPAKREADARKGRPTTPKKPTGQAKTSSGKVVYEIPLDVIGAGQLAIDAYVLANPQPAKREADARKGRPTTPKKPTGQAKTSSGKVVYEVPLDVIGAGQLAIDAWVLANPQ